MYLLVKFAVNCSVIVHLQKFCVPLTILISFDRQLNCVLTEGKTKHSPRCHHYIFHNGVKLFLFSNFTRKQSAKLVFRIQNYTLHTHFQARQFIQTFYLCKTEIYWKHSLFILEVYSSAIPKRIHSHWSYRVFQLDLPQNKHLLGHQKCTFKS